MEFTANVYSLVFDLQVRHLWPMEVHVLQAHIILHPLGSKVYQNPFMSPPNHSSKSSPKRDPFK